MKIYSRIIFLIMVSVMCGIPVLALTDTTKFKEPTESESRHLVFISDLHMSLGKIDGKWHPYEDFRWPNALKGFLDYISKQGDGRTDLIIVGDFLELWQLPSDVSCRGLGANLGCSVEELKRIVRRVISAHTGLTSSGSPRALDALRDFSVTGDNRLYLIPGNHDSALLIPPVWNEISTVLNADSGRIKLVGLKEKGVWVSPDGRIVAEHGHQMGADLNRYKNWPNILDFETQLIVRVEGEQNVQKIFNDVESDYPTIDNLSPEVKGAWYRMQDRGFWGSAKDVAQLAFFLLFETSLKHKHDVLNRDVTSDTSEFVEWDIDFARNILGYEVIAYALPDDDEVRKHLLEEPPSRSNELLRHSFTRMVKEISAEEVSHLCDIVAMRNDKKRCIDPDLSAISGTIFISQGRVKRTHLREQILSYPKMTKFIYGHTHQLEKGHEITVDDETIVEVFNTGAFQRVMDDENYRRRLKKYPGLSPADGLTELILERDFKPCYTAVVAPFLGGRNVPETVRWLMAEDDKGEVVEVGDPRCEW